MNQESKPTTGEGIALSIVIPTYNRLWSLPEAVDSCRKIDSKHEIIVVDDGSTDGTAEWLRKQSDVTSIRTDNWGKDWAVNTALSVAQGSYVRFLDSDDWLEPGSSDEQLKIALSCDADVVVAGLRMFDQRSNTYTLVPPNNFDDFITHELVCQSHYSAYLFKKSFIAGIPHRQEFGANDDRMFVIEVALRHPKVATYEGSAFVHRHHSEGRLQVSTGMAAVANHHAVLRIYQKAARMLESRSELTPERRRAVAASLWPVAHWVAVSHPDEACSLVEWLYELDPKFEIPGEGLLATAYRTLGFRATEGLLRVRRRLLHPLRARRAISEERP